MANDSYSKVYTTFSGADITVSVGNLTVGELQGISYSITREKAPLYTLGSADPRAFSRGKRGISGSLIFLVFNRSPLPSGFPIDDKQFIARPGEVDAFKTGDEIARQNEEQKKPKKKDSEEIGLSFYKPQSAWYADQIPPFDALIKAVNEYGHSAQMEILGIEILNTGSGMSVDDITIDESHTYVARRIKKWYKQRRYDWGHSTGWKEFDYVHTTY